MLSYFNIVFHFCIEVRLKFFKLFADLPLLPVKSAKGSVSACKMAGRSPCFGGTKDNPRLSRG